MVIASFISPRYPRITEPSARHLIQIKRSARQDFRLSLLLSFKCITPLSKFCFHRERFVLLVSGQLLQPCLFSSTG